MRKYWRMCLLIDDIFRQSVSSLHQHIQVFTTRVHLDPARVIGGSWGLKAVD